MSHPEPNAETLIKDHQGIWASDGSPKTIGQRFAQVNLENTPENRRRWRELILTSELPNISGVILHRETFRQASSQGIPFPKLLLSRGRIPIIKVDEGLTPLADTQKLFLTKGLEHLTPKSLKGFYTSGARATKWRAVFPAKPTALSQKHLEENLRLMTQFAKISQQTSLIPIVEPEVLYPGDHSLQDCYLVTKLVLTKLFAYLRQEKIVLSQLLLKTNMVTPGQDRDRYPDTRTVAETTLKCFRETVPAEVSGILLLSGGQNPQLTTQRLNAIAKLAESLKTPLSYSFSRALETEALGVWARNPEDPENRRRSQLILNTRAKAVAAAAKGLYTPDWEKQLNLLTSPAEPPKML